MAFDQNPLPKDLHPLNIVRNAAEDPRLDPVTSSGRPIEGVHTTPLPDLGGSPAVYYPPMVLDAAFVHLGFNNGTVPGVSGLAQHVMSLQQHQTSLVGPTPVNHPVGGHGNSPSFGPPSAGGDLDNASKNGSGGDSVSGHKIKFLCSFGGKILPRLSDGALRYVGGQTRIISVRRDVGFNEFVKKMTDTCAQDSVVKYQLPDGDLDALVSVSCPDDLENMMDEYEKLVERCPDGSGKLRIFLFRPSDIDYEDFAGVGDVQAGAGQTYVQAVNGISDGFSGNSGNSSCIARKESIESVVSGQDSSDLNGTEGGDGLSGNHLGEVIGVPSGGGLSHKRNYVHTYPVSCTEPSLVQGIPVVRTGPGISEQEVEKRMPVNMVTEAPHDESYQPVSPYIQAYWDPQQGNMNHPNFVQNPVEIGYPANILAPVRPFYTQPRLPIPAGVSSQEFNPAMHLTKPTFMMNTSATHAVIQPQHVKDHFTLERVVEISADQGYCARQTQVPVQGDANNWHQVPILDQTAYSEGGLPPQQSVVLVEKVPRFKDCHMCQKALPHVHSDAIALEKNEVPTGTSSDLRSNYWSVHFDGQGRPNIRPVVPIIENNSVEQLAGGSHLRIMGNTDDPEFRKIQMEGITGAVQNVEGPYVNDKAVPQKEENPDALKATFQQGFMVTSGVQYPYGALVANPPPSGQPNCVPSFIVQPQLQVKHDFSPAGIQLQTKDNVLHESPTSYVVKVSGGVPMDEHTSSASGHLRKIEERLENLHLRPSEVLSNNEHNKVVKVPIKEDMHNLMCGELYEMTEPLPVGNPNMYPVSAQGINQSHPNDSSENTVYPSSDPLQAAEQALPASEWKDNNTAWHQSKITGFGDVRGDSTLLYTYFSPTKSSKFLIRKYMGPREDNRVLNTCKQRVLPLAYREEDGGYQQSSNREFSLDHNLSSEASSTHKGSAEELIKQELQVVAEGVGASVLHSSGPSNPDTSSPITQQNIDVQPANVEIQQKDKLEEIKTTLSNKINSGFPASGMGRLQIIRNNDLEELWELGSGTFGTVYHGKWRGTDVAIKRINERCFAGKPSEQDHMREDFWNEAIKLADLHHPNVVAFYGVVLDGPGGSIATVTEFMVNGSLRNALQKRERNLDKRNRLLIGMDVAFGMEYLHGKNIVHFDLKSDNLLVNLRDPHRPICKVGDLGLSKVKCKTLISGGVRGTLPWMAPELLNGSSSLVSEKVDVFSFGIVMWELLTGEEPYADLHYGAIIGGIVSNTLRPPVPETCDPDWRALMETCWSSKPSERPNFAEIANELRAMATKPKGQAQ